ncbi:MAG: LysM peptidoglycan-binding domain-containing protein [Methylococcales bacterium]|nr:LysM peptidoglycan-binding domain-containing protein [Methylococcales bacterium]
MSDDSTQRPEQEEIPEQDIIDNVAIFAVFILAGLLLWIFIDSPDEKALDNSTGESVAYGEAEQEQGQSYLGFEQHDTDSTGIELSGSRVSSTAEESTDTNQDVAVVGLMSGEAAQAQQAHQAQIQAQQARQAQAAQQAAIKKQALETKLQALQAKLTASQAATVAATATAAAAVAKLPAKHGHSHDHSQQAQHAHSPAAELPSAPAAPTAAQIAAEEAKKIALPTIKLTPGDLSQGVLKIGGTGNANGYLQLMLDGKKIAKIDVDEKGVWDYDTHLSPGKYEIKALPIGKNGHVYSEHASFMRVTIPQPPKVQKEQAQAAVTSAAVATTTVVKQIATPTIKFEPTDLNKGRLKVSGTGEPGSHLQLTLNDKEMTTVNVNQQGVWSYDARLKSGDYTIKAVPVDAKGKTNSQQQSEGIRVMVPTRKPSENKNQSVSAAANGSDVKPTITLVPGHLARGLLELSGTAQPNSHLQLDLNGKKLKKISVNDKGAWGYRTRVREGSYAVQVSELDSNGKLNKQQSTSIKVSVPRIKIAGTEAIKKQIQASLDDGLYVVKQGDTLSKLSARFKVGLSELSSANDISDKDLIYVGQKLVIPASLLH